MIWFTGRLLQHFGYRFFFFLILQSTKLSSGVNRLLKSVFDKMWCFVKFNWSKSLSGPFHTFAFTIQCRHNELPLLEWISRKYLCHPRRYKMIQRSESCRFTIRRMAFYDVNNRLIKICSYYFLFIKNKNTPARKEVRKRERKKSLIIYFYHSPRNIHPAPLSMAVMHNLIMFLSVSSWNITILIFRFQFFELSVYDQKKEYHFYRMCCKIDSTNRRGKCIYNNTEAVWSASGRRICSFTQAINQTRNTWNLGPLSYTTRFFSHTHRDIGHKLLCNVTSTHKKYNNIINIDHLNAKSVCTHIFFTVAFFNLYQPTRSVHTFQNKYKCCVIAVKRKDMTDFFQYKSLHDKFHRKICTLVNIQKLKNVEIFSEFITDAKKNASLFFITVTSAKNSLWRMQANAYT